MRGIWGTMMVVALLCCRMSAMEQGTAGVKRVELPYLMWMDGADLGCGETFKNGDSLLFEHDCDVVIFDHVESEYLEIPKGVTVTMIPTGGGVDMGEFLLNGTLVFYAPWVMASDWNITAGEDALIVMDISLFPAQELSEALPGEYHGKLELRSGKLTATRGHGEEKLNFDELRVMDGAQFGLLGGASYAGDVLLMGMGWMNKEEEHAKGAVLMESTKGYDATLSGRVTLTGDTAINVWRMGDVGHITGELHAQGYTLIKEGEGELCLEGKVCSAPGRIEVRAGRVVTMSGWDAGGASFSLEGNGVMEIHGKVTGMSEWHMQNAHVELLDADVQAQFLTGNGNLLARNTNLKVRELHHFFGDIILHNSLLHAAVGEHVYSQRISLDGTSILRAELYCDGKNQQLGVDDVQLGNGSKLELSISLCGDMLCRDRQGGHGVLNGICHFAEGSLLGLHVVQADEPIMHADGGEYVEFVLADHVEGLAQFDQETKTLLKKYFGDTAELRNDDGRLVLRGILISRQNERFHEDVARTFNGRSGAVMLDSLFVGENPQATDPYGDRAAILRAQELLIDQGKEVESDRLSAAVGGASLAALGMALCEIERVSFGRLGSAAQTPVGIGRGQWSAETFGGYNELCGQGTDAGYALNTWGVGVGWRRRGRCASVGLRLEALYGDWRAEAADVARAKLNGCTLGVHYSVWTGDWEQRILAQLGTIGASVQRWVSAGDLSYNTSGTTRGVIGGVAYDAVRKMTSEGFELVLHAAVFATRLRGYNESGSDAALRVEPDQIWRGEAGPGLERRGKGSIAGRCCYWELLGLITGDIGCCESRMNCSLQQGGGRQVRMRGREMSRWAAKIHAGLSIGISRGAVVARIATSLRRQYANFDASLGYARSF